jgi:PiT family inorganic phosphate transporter
VVVVATAPAFDFTNGFHDTANAMATSIATRALRPRVAAGLCTLLNFARPGRGEERHLASLVLDSPPA